MILHPPFMITSRLLPGLKIGNAYVQLAYAKRQDDREGRVKYQWTIDLPDGQEYSDNDLRSGANDCGGSLQEGFASLLSFLGAAAESRQYADRTGRKGENEDLFPSPVVRWASENADEISMLSCEIEETSNLIEE